LFYDIICKMISPDAPRQIVVLGGGLTPDGYPTQETAERTLSAVYYAEAHEVERVVFSGGKGYLAGGIAEDIAEADTMVDLAVESGLDPNRIAGVDRDSRSTFETFLNVRSMLWEEDTGVVTHAYHSPRACYMAKLVLQVPIIRIDALAVDNNKAKAPLGERMLQLATRLAMLTVEAGDEDTMRRRNEAVVRAFDTPHRLSLLKNTVLRNHVSVKALKAEKK
jgi:vancomycin permeability regulator SanA